MGSLQEQIDNFAEVHELVDEIDPTSAYDVFSQAWHQAVALIADPALWVADPALWSAIETLAVELQHGGISGSDIARIVNRVRAA
jgi:hypothetical protein